MSLLQREFSWGNWTHQAWRLQSAATGVRTCVPGNWHDEEAPRMEQEIDGEAGVIPARYRHCDFLLATGGKSQIASLIIGSNDLRSSGL